MGQHNAGPMNYLQLNFYSEGTLAGRWTTHENLLMLIWARTTTSSCSQIPSMCSHGRGSARERPGWLHAPFGRRPVQSPKNSLTLDFSSPHPPHQGIRPRPNATATPLVVWLQTLHHAANGSHPHHSSPKTNRKALPEHTAELEQVAGEARATNPSLTPIRI